MPRRPRPEVRLAGPADEPELLDLLLTMHREGGAIWRAFPYDIEKVKAAIELGTRNRGGIIGVIDAPDHAGRIAASIGLLVDVWWFSRDAFLQQRWLYVRENYRRGTAYADALMKWAEGCRETLAKGIDRPFLFEKSFIEMDPRRAHLKERWWRKWGKKVGTVYLSGF